MENIIKKIKNSAKHTRLSASEKAEIKSVLVRHMKLNPVDSTVLSARGIPTPFFNINNFRNKKGISILVIGSLLMGGTVSFAAENTVPGDVLFPVKVHVNENVRGAVAVTPKAKAEWEVRLVERRLEEVEKIAILPNVLPEIQQLAEENLSRYTKHVENRIAKFEEGEDDEDAMETASKLSDVFNTHEQVLAGLSTNVVTTEVVATTTVQAVTPSVSVRSSSREQAKNTLKKVQGARDGAEKKHKELMEKYAKEKAEKADVETTQPLPQVQAEAKNSKSRSENKDRKSKELKSFRPGGLRPSREPAGSESADSEIRSTVNKDEASAPDIVKPQEETKKVETHSDAPKVEDHD